LLNANDLSLFEQNSSGVNTPIPRMQIAYTESMALASLYFNIELNMTFDKIEPTAIYAKIP